MTFSGVFTIQIENVPYHRSVWPNDLEHVSNMCHMLCSALGQKLVNLSVPGL